MRAFVLTLLVGAAGLAAPAIAAEVTCESKGKAQTSCDMDTRGEVKLVRQLSRAACTEGVSWGLSKHSVWVSDGCRAVFSSGGDSASAPAAANQGGLPLLNAECPGDISVHSDEGGPVYINGKEASLKRSNANYFEATDQKSRDVISLSRNPDETWSVSITADGQGGVCQVR